MPERQTMYSCSICGTAYPNKFAAAICEQSHPKTSNFSIGDYVYTSDWFGTVIDISSSGHTIKVRHPSGRSRWISSSSATLFI